MACSEWCCIESAAYDLVTRRTESRRAEGGWLVSATASDWPGARLIKLRVPLRSAVFPRRRSSAPLVALLGPPRSITAPNKFRFPSHIRNHYIRRAPLLAP